MKLFIIRICIALSVSVWLCDLHMIIYYKWPETASLELSLWLDKSYHFNQSVSWYIHDLTLILKDIVWTYCFALIANLVSHRLFKVLVIFTGYFITQFLFYIIRRNTVFLSVQGYKILISNFIVYLYTGIALLYFIIPSKKGGKLINLEDY